MFNINANHLQSWTNDLPILSTSYQIITISLSLLTAIINRHSQVLNMFVGYCWCWLYQTDMNHYNGREASTSINHHSNHHQPLSLDVPNSHKSSTINPHGLNHDQPIRSTIHLAIINLWLIGDHNQPPVDHPPFNQSPSLCTFIVDESSKSGRKKNNAAAARRVATAPAPPRAAPPHRWWAPRSRPRAVRLEVAGATAGAGWKDGGYDR